MRKWAKRWTYLFTFVVSTFYNPGVNESAWCGPFAMMLWLEVDCRQSSLAMRSLLYEVFGGLWGLCTRSRASRGHEVTRSQRGSTRGTRAQFMYLQTLPGAFTIGFLPIANFLVDISQSDKCLPGFSLITFNSSLCFAHQEKSLPGFIPITILPIYWRIFTHHNFWCQRIAHQTR